MQNVFMASTKRALVCLRTAQARHARLRDRADRRLEAARTKHATEVAAAAQIEADAWRVLLAVPGVSVGTAAALVQVSESTVTRWAGRTGSTTTYVPADGRRSIQGAS